MSTDLLQLSVVNLQAHGRKPYPHGGDDNCSRLGRKCAGRAAIWEEGTVL